MEIIFAHATSNQVMFKYTCRQMCQGLMPYILPSIWTSQVYAEGLFSGLLKKDFLIKAHIRIDTKCLQVK